MVRGLPNTASELTELFAESIVQQEIATFVGDVETVKLCDRVRVPVPKKIMRMGDAAKEEFSRLLDHENRIVRVGAAVYLFTSMPERVLSALQEIAAGDDFAAFCARLRIKEWEEHPEHYDESNWVS